MTTTTLILFCIAGTIIVVFLLSRTALWCKIFGHNYFTKMHKDPRENFEYCSRLFCRKKFTYGENMTEHEYLSWKKNMNLN